MPSGYMRRGEEMNKVDWGKVFAWIGVAIIVAGVAIMFGLEESQTGEMRNWSPVAPWIFLAMGSIPLGWRARKKEPWKIENVIGLTIMLVGLTLVTSYNVSCDREGCISRYNLVLGAGFTLLAFMVGFSVGLIY